MEEKDRIINGQTTLGINIGTARMKSVLIDLQGHILAAGSYDWEDCFSDIPKGIRGCYGALRSEVEKRYGVTLRQIGAIGVSSFCYGLVAFVKDTKSAMPLKNKENENIVRAKDILTELFLQEISCEHGIAQLYGRILEEKEYAGQISCVTTLSGYLHSLLTGRKVIGSGDAKRMFPLNTYTADFDERMVKKFNALLAPYGYDWKLRHIFPQVLPAGEEAGKLTEEGAALMDETGNLMPGVLFCPPEGEETTAQAAGAIAFFDERKGEKIENSAYGSALLAAFLIERRSGERFTDYLETINKNIENWPF